jgi:hypothetical protein
MPSQDTGMMESYLHTYDLDKVSYENIAQGTSKALTMKVGNVKEELHGVQIGNERFAIHLIHCDQETNSCAFRVNGKATGLISAKDDTPNAVALNAQYLLKVDHIAFDYCDGRRFCDHNFQAYDIVNISVLLR